MLEIKILNENNTLINEEIEKFVFYSGETRTMRLQIWSSDCNAPYRIENGATITLTLQKSDDTTFDLTPTAQTDRSVITSELTTTNTTDMINGGQLLVKIIEDTSTRYVVKKNALEKIST